MKLITKTLTLLSITLLSIAAWAQDKKIDVDINVKQDNWYERPWVWIIGGAVFILLLVALLRPKGKTD